MTEDVIGLPRPTRFQSMMEDVIGLPRPAGFQSKTNQKMTELVYHLYMTRAMTAKQLARVAGMGQENLYVKLDKYSHISKSNQPMLMYDEVPTNNEVGPSDDWRWYEVSRVSVHYLTQDRVWEFERMNNWHRYTTQQDRDPRPRNNVLNRYIMMSEIYSRLVPVGMYDEGVEWLPNILFDQVVESRKESNGKYAPYALLNGIVYSPTDRVEDAKLFGCTIFQGDTRTIKYNLKKAADKDNSVLYQGLVFIMNDSIKRAIPLVVGPFDYLMMIPYEWAVKNPRGVIYMIKEDAGSVLAPLFNTYEKRGLKVVSTKPTESYFRWKVVTPDHLTIEYIDTTVGSLIGFTNGRVTEASSDNIPRTMYCTTEQECAGWKDDKINPNNTKFRVIDWEIP